MSDAKSNKPVVYVIYYSMYGHIAKMAEHVAKGAEAAGGEVHIFQVPETLPKEVLEKMHAPPKKDHPIISVEYVGHCAYGFYCLACCLWHRDSIVGSRSIFHWVCTQGSGQG